MIKTVFFVSWIWVWHLAQSIHIGKKGICVRNITTRYTNKLIFIRFVKCSDNARQFFFVCYGGMRSKTGKKNTKNSGKKRVKMWKYLAPPTLFHLHEFIPKINDPIQNWTWGNEKKNSKYNWQTNNLQSHKKINRKKNTEKEMEREKKHARIEVNVFRIAMARRLVCDCWLLSKPNSLIAAFVLTILLMTIMRHSFLVWFFITRKLKMAFNDKWTTRQHSNQITLFDDTKNAKINQAS